MQIATELPVHCQNILAALTDYDFCIGPVYIQNTEYAAFYREQRQKGRFVILDNGAFEGNLLPEGKLMKIVRELHPQEVVAPDVIGNRQETFERAKKFINLMEGRPVHVQVCPQGRSFTEWLKSYKELADLPGVSALGISYVGHFRIPEDCDYFGSDLPPQETVRLRFFHYLAGLKQLREDKEHHLLGLYSAAALKWYSMYPFIRSIDTSFPVLCAVHRARMTEATEKFPDKLDYDRKLDDRELILAIENIQWFRKACQSQ